jgi:hypothetical protein
MYSYAARGVIIHTIIIIIHLTFPAHASVMTRMFALCEFVAFNQLCFVMQVPSLLCQTGKIFIVICISKFLSVNKIDMI